MDNTYTLRTFTQLQICFIFKAFHDAHAYEQRHFLMPQHIVKHTISEIGAGYLMHGLIQMLMLAGQHDAFTLGSFRRLR